MMIIGWLSIVLTIIITVVGYAIYQTKWQTKHDYELAAIARAQRYFSRRLMLVEKQIGLTGYTYMEGDVDDSTNDRSD